jgi:phosphopantetheinyl transferase (holo-ACP synthase)
MKALGTGWSAGVRWVDIETVARERKGGKSAPGGKIRLVGVDLAIALHGGAAERARLLGGAQPHLAVSRTRSHAVALVLLESADTAPERGGR